MFTLSNPYNWQRINSELFYGRIELAHDLVHRLVNGQSFGIAGGRKMGKTTLLRRIENDLLSYAVKAKQGGLLILPIYIEICSLSLDISYDSIYQEIIDLIKKKLSIFSIHIEDRSGYINSIEFRKFLQTVVNSITDYHPQIIFIFDGIEPITQSSWSLRFFGNWNSLLQNTPNLSNYLSAIFSGASEMYEIARNIGSPLGNILVWRELELFSLNDVALFICEVSQYQWTDMFIQKIYKLTGGHPFLIQYIMHFISNYDNEKSLLSIEYAKVQFLNEQKVIFQTWWNKFDNTTRTIYAQLVEKKSLTRSRIILEFGSLANRGIEILAHTGVVRIDWETDTIQVAGSLFSEWFTQFGAIEITLNLADNIENQNKVIQLQSANKEIESIKQYLKSSFLEQVDINSLDTALSLYNQGSYLDAMRILFPFIELIANKMLLESGENQNFSGLSNKLKKLEDLKLISSDLFNSIDITTSRNKVLHGQYRPQDEEYAYPICIVSIMYLCRMLDAFKEMKFRSSSSNT